MNADSQTLAALAAQLRIENADLREREKIAAEVNAQLKARVAELEAERENWRMSSVCREAVARAETAEARVVTLESELARATRECGDATRDCLTAIRQRNEAETQAMSALRLVTDIRFALGDNGKRMQPELIAWCRELAAKARA